MQDTTKSNGNFVKQKSNSSAENHKNELKSVHVWRYKMWILCIYDQLGRMDNEKQLELSQLMNESRNLTK